MSIKVKLIVVGGAAEEAEVTLRLPAIIGRGRSAQITIAHALVSRQHCEITEVNGQLCVRDLGSLNGTYIGDKKITEAALDPGGLLTVGTVTFRAIYEADVEAASSMDVLDKDTVPSSQSTVGGLPAVDEDTTRLEPGTLPDDFLPPLALPAAGHEATCRTSAEKASQATDQDAVKTSLEKTE